MPKSNYGKMEILVGGEWKESASSELHRSFNPATGSEIAEVPFVSRDEVEEATSAAAEAFKKWHDFPITERVKYLSKMKLVFENHFEELATLNTQNHGKTIQESRGDIRRALENIDAAIGAAYVLGKGENLEQIAEGIDESSTKEPLGAFAIVCPFNFPIMIPFWFIPYAIALGDTVVVKPSELDPIPTTQLIRMIQEETKLPPGVLNLVQGGKEAVQSLISSKEISGVTFVGSTGVAKQVFELAGKYGKRSIVNGGAKNSLVILPDADLGHAIPSIISSSFGNAGQRCLAGSNVITVGGIHEKTVDNLVTSANKLRVGNGMDESTEMGPVVSESAMKRIENYIQKGVSEHAKLKTDGRKIKVQEYPDGFYIGPTVFDNVEPQMAIAKEEIFGPVLSVMSVDKVEDAIELINSGTSFGNMASLFTSSGLAAREFRRRVNAGNIGINAGVAAPSAFFPFGGRKESFYGTLHAQIDTVDFFTDTKVTIARW